MPWNDRTVEECTPAECALFSCSDRAAGALGLPEKLTSTEHQKWKEVFESLFVGHLSEKQLDALGDFIEGPLQEIQ